MDSMDVRMETSSLNQEGNRRLWLTLARKLVDDGKPSQALQAVVAAVKSEGGDRAVLQTLDRARELYRKRLEASATVNQLAALFAECAITEAQSEPINPSGQPIPLPFHTEEFVTSTSILSMSGRNQVILDAFSDGSSFVCLKCGGLVSNQRKDEHVAYWCSHT